MRIDFRFINIVISLFIMALQTLSLQGKCQKLQAESKLKAACKVFEAAVGKEPNNVQALQNLGNCYLNLKNKRLAIMYLQKAVDLQPEPTISLLADLAAAYHLSHQFQLAIDVYERLDAISPDKAKIARLKAQCENGMEMLANPLEVSFVNLGNNVNSTYDEFAPFVGVDQQSLYYNSNKPVSLSKSSQNQAKVYVSQSKGTWDKPKTVFPSSAGIIFQEEIVGLAPDAKTMLVVRQGRGKDLFFSYLQNGKWSALEPFQHNSPKNETGACLSVDGKHLYFVSDRGGSKDVYHAQRIDGKKWTKPVKLSNKVNTEFDEECPYLDPSGKHLFFSSNGHTTMGGYDVFRVNMAGKDPVGLPENLGYPINTASDDMYYMQAADGKTAWYATERDGGFGGLDVYAIRLSVAVEQQGSLAVFKGTTFDEERNTPMQASIIVTDIATNAVVTKLESNAETGFFSVTLPQGKTYTILVEKPGYLFHSESIGIKDGDGYWETKKDIKLSKLKKGARIVLNNIYFDQKRSSIRRESGPELLRLVNLMRQNPGIVVEIGGHTDNTLEFTQNLKLSDARARSVVDYLVAIGITSNRLMAKGYGSAMPLGNNQTAEGRKQNNRMEFTILNL